MYRYAKDLSGELPREFGRLDALETLDLESNDITGIPAGIGQLTSLKEFDIRGNLLTSVPSELGRCVGLEELWWGCTS
jgi:leucine-rich repeat protein SHOC2